MRGIHAQKCPLHEAFGIVHTNATPPAPLASVSVDRSVVPRVFPGRYSIRTPGYTHPDGDRSGGVSPPAGPPRFRRRIPLLAIERSRAVHRAR